ncbi:MAG: hypothetical protein HYR91_10055 [Flavobacteriia bacterium]|nr:hypothetical protein [Flavobacteriia bacterium]
MSVFTYHLVKTSYISTLRVIFSSLNSQKIPGLIHAERMTFMILGSPIISKKRMLFNKIVIFAQWENESDINNFLENNKIGKILSNGWHTRLIFLRQWGELSELILTDEIHQNNSCELPVVAVTIARMKFFQIPRFIKWGRLVEKLVRDHNGTTLSLASIRFPNTISTFSIWKTQKEMTDMVQGHSNIPQPNRHSDAIKESIRKDFHYEFTTLRFKPISEFGEWNGNSNFIPNLKI